MTDDSSPFTITTSLCDSLKRSGSTHYHKPVTYYHVRYADGSSLKSRMKSGELVGVCFQSQEQAEQAAANAVDGVYQPPEAIEHLAAERRA